MKPESKEKLKQEGWGLLRDVLNIVADRGVAMLDIIIQDTENKIDDMLLPALDKVKEFIKGLIEKIGK